MPDLAKDSLADFDPRAVENRRRLWVRVVTPDAAYWHVFWGRLAGALLLLVIGTWFVAAAGAWAVVKYRRGFADAAYLDVAFYPWRKAEFNRARGRHHLAAGRAELAKGPAGDVGLAYSHLTNGARLLPEEFAGHHEVAQLQARLRRPDLAIRTLIGGLPAVRENIEYVRLLFALLFEAQQDEHALQLATGLLPAQPNENYFHLFVSAQAAAAHYHRGRYDEAEKIIARWRLDRSLEGQITLVRCDWERGYPALALLRLDAQIERFPAQDEFQVQRLRFLRELGRTDEARRLALVRHLRLPTSSAARADYLYALRSSGEATALHRETDAYLRDFAADPNALLRLAAYASDSGDSALAERIHGCAVAARQPMNKLNLLLVEAAINAQQPRAALAAADRALAEENEGDKFYPAGLDALRAVAHHALGEADVGELRLNACLGKIEFRAADSLRLAHLLGHAGATESARRVLAIGVRADPLNQAALTELVRLDARRGTHDDLAVGTAALLTLRKPARPVLEEALLRLDRLADAPLREKIRTRLALTTATPEPHW